jgi:hypothetical protein
MASTFISGATRERIGGSWPSPSRAIDAVRSALRRFRAGE